MSDKLAWIRMIWESLKRSGTVHTQMHMRLDPRDMKDAPAVEVDLVGRVSQSRSAIFYGWTLRVDEEFGEDPGYNNVQNEGIEQKVKK